MKIDQVRQLREVLALQAYEGRVKVAILDNVGQLTVEAGNALLKILEEPPAETLFVLICQHLGNLPATVISRSQVVRFGLLAHAQVVALQRAGTESEASRTQHPSARAALEPPWPLISPPPWLGAVRRRSSCGLRGGGQSPRWLASAEQWGKRKATMPCSSPCSFTRP